MNRDYISIWKFDWEFDKFRSTHECNGEIDKMCDVCVDFLSLLVACRSQNYLFITCIYLFCHKILFFFFSFVIIPVAFVLHSVHCLRSILVSIVVCIARMFMTNKKKNWYTSIECCMLWCCTDIDVKTYFFFCCNFIYPRKRYDCCGSFIACKMTCSVCSMLTICRC